MKTITKDDIKEMIASIDQRIVYEDNNTIQVENIYVGEDIIFNFIGGYLISIGS